MANNLNQTLPSPDKPQAGALARRLFDRMLEAAGPRHWWPCDPGAPNCGRDEMIIGAVLTQNTAWTNVEHALANLRREGLLDLQKLALLAPEAIAPWIRPAGYYNLKAKRLATVAQFFAPDGRYRFDELEKMGDGELREALLGVFGVGRETADSILLYALKRLTFVVDAYTLRLGRRHGILGEEADYETARAWFTRQALATVEHYNEYHALIVWIGKNFCKPTPRCGDCPLFEKSCFATREAWMKMQLFKSITTK